MTQTFGALLRHLRRRNGLTQEELAERLGYSRSMVAALETNRRMLDVEAVNNSVVPALDLHDSRELVEQMIELASLARPATLSGHPQPATPTSLQPIDDSGRVPFRVPLTPSRVYGRERELQRVCERILYHHVRLVTLTGPPGVGKTTFALEAATRLQRYQPDGACWIPLAGVSDVEVVPSAIVDALGSRSHRGAALEALIAFLRRKEMVLVLDNFEQILDAASVVARLLAECAGVRVLVTSRERLHLRAEHVMQLQPLATNDAVDLFHVRARASSSGSMRGQIDPATVEAICRRIDCLPLAIELCAAQTDYYTPAQILERLQSNALETLVDGAVDLAPRHRSLRETIHSSYELLTADECALLQALSVFADGGAPEMVAMVWAEAEDAQARTDKLLRSLVAKNLVQLEQTAWGDQRLLLLESIREFARERLEESGNLTAMQVRHFAAVHAFARLAEPLLWTGDCLVWLKRMRRETDNMNAALHWAAEQERWFDMASLFLLLNRSFDTGARWSEYADWCEVLLPHCETLGPDIEMKIKAHYCHFANTDDRRNKAKSIQQTFPRLIDACVNPLIKADALLYGADFGINSPNPVEALKQAVDLARTGRNTSEMLLVFGYQNGREVTLPWSLGIYADYLVDRGETEESLVLKQEALDLSRAANHVVDFACCLGCLGRVAILKHEYGEAITLFEQAVECSIEVDDEPAIAMWRAFLGLALLYTGDLAGARRTLVQAWEDCIDYGGSSVMQTAALFSAEAALFDGSVEEARLWLEQSMALSAGKSRDLDWRHIHRAMLAARLAVAEGNDVRAARLYGFALAYSDRIKIGPTGPVIDTAAPTMAEVRARLGEESYRDAYEKGKDLPVQETLASLLLPTV